ncbi:hypothetical protein OAF43_02420 [bacterium]|nr:hypothetical protein [bacterium]
MKHLQLTTAAAVVLAGCERYGVVCPDQIGCRALAQALHFGGLFFEQKNIPESGQDRYDLYTAPLGNNQ